jgi:hypothetical protein
MSFGEYLYAVEFIKKTAPGPLSYTPNKANQRQQVIRAVKTTKDNYRRFQKTPRRSVGQKLTIVGWLAH